MTKKTVTLVSAAIVLVLGMCVITGCNNNSGSSSAPGQQTPPVVPTPPVTSSDPNGEGVRADVRAYIEATYPDSAKIRAALFQEAKAMEKALADANDKQLSIGHAEELNRASECLTYVLGDDAAAVTTAYHIDQKLLPVILNTDARNQAYFAYDDQLGGQVFKLTPDSQIASTCDIDPSTLPN